MGAGPIFHDIFLRLYSESSQKPNWYLRPNHIVSVRVDPLNGKRLPQSKFDSHFLQARHARPEWFRSPNMPLVASARDYDVQGRTLLPTRYASWFSDANHNLQNRAAIQLTRGDPLSNKTPIKILSPLPNTVIYLDADLPNGGRFFTLHTTATRSKLIWTCPTLQIDADETSAPFAILKPGTHLLTVTDLANGYSTSVSVKVESL